MRPYFAIIKDSFRAAFASRVLYVLLALITVLLVAIAPIHYRELLDWKIIRDQHVPNPAFLVELLIANKDEEGTGVKRVWESLSDSLQKDLLAIVQRDVLKDQEANNNDSPESNDTALENDDDSRGGGRPAQDNPLEDFPVYDALIDQLNTTIQDRDFYRSEDWENLSVSTSPEAAELIESGVANLSDEHSRRLNRVLISDALGPAIQNGAATALDFYYLFWKIPIFSTNATHQQFASTFSATIPWFFDKFVMSIGLFIAILVTANIIPETFDPGSLNLLLSKPITRSGLLIAKFIGGCAFVALCTFYLFVGAWLWLGLGMGIWDRGILFAVPVYILVFAIYYSVSTLVGIWYRSAILSVILTGLFWAICFGVGFIYARLDNRMRNGEITDLVPYQDSRILQVDPLSKVSVWDEKTNEWVTALKPNMAQEQEIGIGIVLFTAQLDELPTDMLGPVYDSNSKRLISGSINLGDPRTFNQQECFVTDPNDTNFAAQGKFPRNAVALFATPAGSISLNSSGEVFVLKPHVLGGITTGKSASAGEATDKVTEESESPDQEIQPKSRATKAPELFEKYGTTKTSIRNGAYVDLNQKNQEIVIYRRGERDIRLFEPTEQGYKLKASLEIDTGFESKSMSCRVSYQGNTITLAFGNGQLITVDAMTLKEKNGYLPETRSAVKQLVASHDGRWVAVVHRNNMLWLLDNENPDQIKKANFGHQGTISAVRFAAPNRIWVAYDSDRAMLYDLETKKQLRNYSPDSNWYAFAYRYVVGPLYKVFPKPGELYKVVTYLSSTGDTKYNREVDLAQGSETRDPFGPLWSGLGFMGLVLCLSCLLFQYKDF